MRLRLQVTIAHAQESVQMTASLQISLDRWIATLPPNIAYTLQYCHNFPIRGLEWARPNAQAHNVLYGYFTNEIDCF